MARELYRYDPSLAAAVIFIILFMASAVVHTWQLFKTKNWFFIPFLLGCLAEAIGCIGRAVGAKESPDWSLTPYIIQALLLLLGPTMFAASIYMILGRMIRLLEAEELSFIRPSWLTKFFLVGDIISIAAQGFGGTKLSKAETPADRNQGETIIIAGLGVQIAFFGLFIITTLVLHRRINRDPTPKSARLTVPWRRLLAVLYVTSMLILVRSVFRLVEYVMGHDGVLQSREVYIYVFDILLMAAVAVIFNVFHPSGTITASQKAKAGSTESEIHLGSYGPINPV
ncbi:unnamed protein product [Clonostachys rosea]|uniref:Uncharacterized protein n=1 Tax=Bionectria ochroleuca TaxID=29856 RepID=A0ABY6TZW3_BIOOC|nr:unnamed protein product [Clonostachys rosea]